jgi:hypothetical protein
MKKFLVLAFALVFVAAIHVVPQLDLADGDGGFSYAVLAKYHFHPLSGTNLANQPTRGFIAATQTSKRGFARLDIGTAYAQSAGLATVLRC